MIQFHSGEPEKGFKSDVESFLFNTHTHRMLQSKTGWLEFHLIDTKKKRILSSIFFHVSKNNAKSPFKAPFGSFELSPKVQPEDFYGFTLWLEKELSKKKIQQIEILCPPELYTTTQPLITTTLVSQGYQLVESEPGCGIPVDGEPLPTKMDKDKRIRFRQGVKAGFIFEKIPLNKLSEIYKFIERYRKKLNRNLSMTEAQLAKTVETLPQSFFIVGVYLHHELVAACICIHVTKSIVYTFYSAHNDNFDKLSPRVFLLAKLYDWCYAHKVTLLDLGTSALDHKPNFTLLDFKLRVGGTLTPKFRFQKNLVP